MVKIKRDEESYLFREKLIEGKSPEEAIKEIKQTKECVLNNHKSFNSIIKENENLKSKLLKQEIKIKQLNNKIKENTNTNLKKGISMIAEPTANINHLNKLKHYIINFPNCMLKEILRDTFMNRRIAELGLNYLKSNNLIERDEDCKYKIKNG